MTEYSPQVSDPQIQAELQRIAQLIISLGEHIWVEEFAEPDKPRKGMVRFADGTTWDPGSGAGMYLYNGATWNFLQGAGGSGETNTGSNQGTDGIGVFDNKVGVDLQFRHIAPASSKMSVALLGKDIDLDVNDVNLSIAIGQVTGFTDNSGDWDTAFGWGDHSIIGYLTSFTEADPVFLAHDAAAVTAVLIGNWNTAFGWGNHAGLYSVLAHTHTLNTGATDVTAIAAELNLLDLGGLTAGDVLSADSASAASWKPQTGGGTDFLDITEFDDTDSTYYFYGGENLAGDWQVNRYHKTTFVVTRANEIGDPAYTTLAAAWPNRLTLTYS
jgi:hypothetical protein